MTEIPRSILGLSSWRRDDVAVGAVFLPRQKEAAAARSRHLLVTSLALHGLVLAEWRDVPIDENALGEKAKNCRPDIFYVIVAVRQIARARIVR